MKDVKKILKKLLVLICMIVAIMPFSGCKKFNETGYSEAIYSVESTFSKIIMDIDGGVNLEFSYGDEFLITYTCSNQETFRFIENAGTLSINQYRTHSNLNNYKSKELKIIVPFENEISLISMDVDGALNCSINGFVEELELDVDGAINAIFVGSANKLYIDCDGATSINGKDFITEYATFNVDGALNFELNCNKHLLIECNGVCNGVYYGECELEKRISGISNIKHR